MPSDSPFRRAATLLSLLMAAWLLVSNLGGCAAISALAEPGDRLYFPTRPVKVTAEGEWYDVRGRGWADFGVLTDAQGRARTLAYDDDGDGKPDRLYRLDDNDPTQTPHLIVLVDSLPYRLAKAQEDQGNFRFLYPPGKVIAPFPSMSIVIFNDILGGPPMDGSIERYYDLRKNHVQNEFVKQALGWRHPFHFRFDYSMDEYYQIGFMYLNPRPWFHYEIFRIKKAFDESLHRLSVSYIAAGSAMASAYGQNGIEEVLGGLKQLALQVLYERRGHVNISFVSDHGHNLAPSRNVPVTDWVRDAGFNPTTEIQDPKRDVFVEIDGLVTYFGAVTSQPKVLADAILKHPEVTLGMYLDGQRVVVCNQAGAAAIDYRLGRYRYTPQTADVLGYAGVLARLRAAGKVDAEGFVADADWFAATVDLEYPDGPRRLWDAFHAQVNAPANVMFVLRDGYCAGIGMFDQMMKMDSTHGGLNQINSDAVVWTTIRPVTQSFRSRDVLRWLDPRYNPDLIVRQPDEYPIRRWIAP